MHNMTHFFKKKYMYVNDVNMSKHLPITLNELRQTISVCCYRNVIAAIRERKM